MKKITPLFFVLLSCLSSLSAQEVVSVEDQGTTFAIILNLALPITVENNVQNYKLTYTTTDAFGQPDTATGLFCIPQGVTDSLPIVVYNHGTIASRDLAPSVPGVLERFIVQAFSGSGFVALAPDYLGLGDSDGLHPYLHAATEASAGRDMILAVKAWMADQNVTDNGQLFTTGYSQGGHASMALHRDIELNPGDDGLEITAAAHLSGAYQIAPPSPALLGLTQVNPTQLSFFLYTLLSYNATNNLYGPVDQLFKEPYLTEINRFLAEETDLYEMGNEIDTLMQANSALLGQIFVDAFVADVLDNDPDLLRAYTDNTVSDWAPNAPTLLYYCNGDLTVSPNQSIVADSVMALLGADSLYLEDGGPLDHGPCATPAAVRALRFFQSYPRPYPVSLGEPAERPEIALVPNPATAGTKVRFPGLRPSQADYVIYDFSGRQLVSGLTTTDGQLPLPANLSSGMYLVRVALPRGKSLVRRVRVR